MTSCVSLKQTNYVEFLLCTFCIVLDYTAQWVRTQSEWIHGLCPAAQPQHSPCPRCLLWRRTWQVMLEPQAHPSRCCRGHWDPVVSWCPGSVALPTVYVAVFYCSFQNEMQEIPAEGNGQKRWKRLRSASCQF